MRRYMEIAGRLARLHGTRGGNVPARRGASFMQLQFLRDAGNMDTKTRTGSEG